MPPSSPAPEPSPPGAGVDVLIVSVGATTGWRASARELEAAFDRAGARAATVQAGPVRDVRSFMLTDLVQARAARDAARRGIAEYRPRAIVYCSVTAALLWPAPGAVWVDAVAAENRPGRHGVWQRWVERRRLARSPLVLAMGPGALAALGPGPWDDAVVVPTAVDPSGPPAPERDIAVLAYAADPVKRRLDLIIDRWTQVRRESETLVVAGIERADARPGVRFAGQLSPDAYRALLRRARVFAAAPRREDYGIAALEALADGAMLATTPAPGLYPALRLARELDPRLVSDDLGASLRAALDTPAPGYAERAAALVAPFGRAAVARTVGEDVLPRLLPGWGA